jgi:hypothetical protein
MDLLIIEPNPSTRRLLVELVSSSLDADITALGSFDGAAGPYTALLICADTIQGLEKVIDRCCTEDTLVIQASLRFNVPGAGVDVQSLKRREPLISKIDRTLPGWPFQLISRLRAHEARLELINRLSALVEVEGRREFYDATSLMRDIARARDLCGDHLEFADLVRIPPTSVRDLEAESKPLPEQSGPFEIHLHTTTKVRVAVAEAYAQELSVLAACFRTLGRLLPKESFRIHLLPAEEIPLVCREAFSYDRSMVIPIFRRSWDPAFELTPNEGARVKTELARLYNAFERPQFSTEWDWFDLALSRHFAHREDDVPGCGWGRPLDSLENLEEGWRFVKFLEGALGARSLCAIWRSPGPAPLVRFARDRLIDDYFRDWLPRAYWDDMMSSSQKTNPLPVLDHCSCHVRGLPEGQHKLVVSTPDKYSRIRAALVQRFDSGTRSLGTNLINGISLQVPARKQGEERILLIRNIGHRHRKKFAAHDDGLEYDYSTGTM